MRLQLKLTLALLATVALGAVVQLCVAEDTKQASYYRDDEHHHHPSAPSAGDNDKHHAQGDAYAGDDKATPSHAKHIYVDAPAPALGQSYSIPVLKRTMPWPEGTTLAQLAAQAAAQRQALKRGAEDDRELPNARDVVRHHRRQGKRQAPGGQARQGHLDAVQADPMGGYGEYEHYDGPHAHVERSFTGLIAYDNQAVGNSPGWTPPDQGLCVGNGFILEAINNVMRVYHEDGSPATPPLATYSFLGYLPDFDSPVTYMTDPSCWYDMKSRRWFYVMWGAQLSPTDSSFTGPTWLEVAVSASSNPTGAWHYYKVPASNNGDDNTPDFGCAGGYCEPDYPQMAVWDHALVITVNVYATLNTDIFYGAMVYALDKEALVQGLAAAHTILVDPGLRGNVGNDANAPLLDTLIPARQSSTCELVNEFIMGTPPARYDGWVDTLQLLRLRGTSSIGTANPHVTLEWVEPGVKLPFAYTQPPPANQKRGVNPRGITFVDATEMVLLDAGDARMASVAFVDDKLYVAWGTKVQGVAGAAWALVDPRRPARALDGSLISMPGGNNLVYPYLAVRAGGEGVMALTVSGPDFFPSPAYAVLTHRGVGRVKLIVNGVGPLDNSDAYGPPVDSPLYNIARYGDYSAALVDQTGAFWLASEWVAQSCTVAEFQADDTCGHTRTRRRNHATRVSKVVLRT